MFGLEYIPAFIKIAFNIAFAIVTAIPFSFCWNRLAPIYFNIIPEIYQNIPFWHMAGLLLICTFIGEQIAKLTPTIVSISQSNSN